MTATRLTLRMPEVAAQLGVHPTTVQRWVAEGLLPHVRVKGVVLVKPEQLDAFLAAHTEGDHLTQRRATRHSA